MKSILVIDSPTLAKLFAEVFDKLGWTVAICNDRECAMRRVEPYDLILLSYHLPGTDGVQLTRFIRSFEHRMTTAVVMLTSSEITDEAKAAGVDEVLIKPVNVSTLIWAVNKHV
jgi:CheY-like chemotaxis protein